MKNMQWKIALSKECSTWLQALPLDARVSLVNALRAITKTTTGPWEVKTKDIEITRLPSESPALYKMIVLRVTPTTGIVYGLVGDWIVPVLWGVLPSPMPQAMLKIAHEAIETFKRSKS